MPNVPGTYLQNRRLQQNDVSACLRVAAAAAAAVAVVVAGGGGVGVGAVTGYCLNGFAASALRRCIVVSLHGVCVC